MTRRSGFTLAEVLITLSIIGVVAALTIPSVIVNNQALEFRTALKKAVSVLNQAVTMNVALDNEGPGDTSSSKDLMEMFVKRMNVIRTMDAVKFGTFTGTNQAFYTADGMRYEVPKADISMKLGTETLQTITPTETKRCSKTTPCLIIVDVNGDKRPSPDANNKYKLTKDTTKIYDVYPLIITDTTVTPLGAAAQELMFSK